MSCDDCGGGGGEWHVRCKIPLATALRSTPPQEVLPSRAERNDDRHGQSGEVATRRRGQRCGVNPQVAQRCQRPAGDAGTEAHHSCGEGEQMAEAGMLSIMRCGITYQVRDASSNPHDMDRQPYPCPDEGTLVALLHHDGLAAWSLHRALAELRHGRMAVLTIVLAEAQRQRYFPRSPRGPSRRRST